MEETATDLATSNSATSAADEAAASIAAAVVSSSSRRPVSSSPEEGEKGLEGGSALEEAIMTSTTVENTPAATDSGIEETEAMEEEVAIDGNKEETQKKRGKIHIKLGGGSSQPHGSSDSSTGKLLLLGGNSRIPKKRKRKLHSNNGGGVLSSFQDEQEGCSDDSNFDDDDANNNKPMLDEFLFHDDAGALTARGTNNATAASNNEDNDNFGGACGDSSSYHLGVIPPDRVMSPMPQNERDNVPLCHSPNVPPENQPTNSTSSSWLVAATNTNSATTTTATSGVSRIRMQQQNNIGQMRTLQQQQQQPQQQKQQPPGWRVKLYRLNIDGTWDDCGTGRIQFYYAASSRSSSSGSSSNHHHQEQGQQKGSSSNSGDYAAVAGDGGINYNLGKRPMSPSSSKKLSPLQPQQTTSTNTSSMNLFRELGEPMLCMRAELSQKQQQRHHQQLQANNNNNFNNTENKSNAANSNIDGSGSSSIMTTLGEKVLLRTRVLLHEAYQCQGGNIITWCEPFHIHHHGKQQKERDAGGSSSSSSSNAPSGRQQQQHHQLQQHHNHHQQQQSSDATPAGVDLALSFQDNAGCKDIWQHILNVQSRAREATTHFTNNNVTLSSSFSNSSSPSPSSCHTPLSPNKPTTSSTHHSHGHPTHNSPNSPDHDFLEDKLISSGGGLGNISRPPMWTMDSNIIGGASSSSLASLSSPSSLTHVENRLLHSHNYTPASSKSPLSSSLPPSPLDDDEEDYHDAVDHMTAVSMAAVAAASYKPPNDGYNTGDFESNVSSPLSMGGGGATPHGFHINNINNSDPNIAVSPLQLPKVPTWDDLQNIEDIIAGVQLQQREDFSIFLSQSDCAYIKLLLQLFPPAEERGADITELAVIIKTILLLNDPEIIEYVTADAPTFELICGVLEYDPELREKANHRDFIRSRAKFRTVVRMEDEELVSHIHHLFRVTYLRDHVLRPTMDESALSTLVSLAQFTQSDIIKGVITPPKVKFTAVGVEGNNIELPGMSYLSKILRLLSAEIDAIRKINSDGEESNTPVACPQNQYAGTEGQEEGLECTMWQQHLAPQDSLLSSRHIRRKGCLMFLKELFCKARVSLQQPEKDEFIETAVSKSKLLCLLGAILSDPNVMADERGAALEIVSVVAMHDPSVIRRHCLQGVGAAAEDSSNEMFSCLRPDANDHREVIFICPPNDLLLSILFVMATETDAGLLLQTSEIIRIILDTDILGDQGSLSGSFMNEENDANAMNSQIIRHDVGSEEQNSFLALFYDRYIEWLVLPFQYKVFISKSILPLLSESNRDESFHAINRKRQEFKHCSASNEKTLTMSPACAVRASLTLEILSFCVRTHIYRMKFFILRTRLLGTVLKLLSQKISQQISSSEKCLKLASLKLLRSVLSVKDEFYHRHIVQYNLFAPVFDIFRLNPVGGNLISSAILEMCDFIRVENIKSLLEYIVTKHLSKSNSPGEESLEDIANPRVDTFAQLRRAHEENTGVRLDLNEEGPPGQNDDEVTFSGRPPPVINKKALEDQRKFRESETEDSYFNDDDDDDMEPLPNKQSASLQKMTDTASLLADVASLE